MRGYRDRDTQIHAEDELNRWITSGRDVGMCMHGFVASTVSGLRSTDRPPPLCVRRQVRL
jgi:hypothetical protein